MNSAQNGPRDIDVKTSKFLPENAMVVLPLSSRVEWCPWFPRSVMVWVVLVFVRTYGDNGKEERGTGERDRGRGRVSVCVSVCVCGPTHATPHKTTHNVTKTN